MIQRTVRFLSHEYPHVDKLALRGLVLIMLYCARTA